MQIFRGIHWSVDRKILQGAELSLPFSPCYIAYCFVVSKRVLQYPSEQFAILCISYTASLKNARKSFLIFLLLFPKYTSEKGVLSINKHHFSKIFLLKKSVLWKGTDCGTEMKKKTFFEVYISAGSANRNCSNTKRQEIRIF